MPLFSNLNSQLNEKKNAFLEKASAEKIEIYDAGIQEIRDAKIIDNAIQKGDNAIDFSLNNAANESVNLKELLKNGPVILTWYRGGWCPYCNITLHYLQEQLPEFKKYNAQLVALTPELPDKSLSTKEKHQFDFEVLSDLDNKIAKEYGIVFKLNDQVSTIYNQNFNLNEYNGNENNELPLAATYIINTDGKIVYSFLDADYRNRAEPSELIEVLKNL